MRVFLPVIVFNCLILVSEEGFGTIPEVDIKKIVVAQDIAVRVHSPNARLFQVFLPDFVPEPKLSEYRSDFEIHGYFEINKTKDFLEAITKDSKEMVEIAKPFEGHDCFHGYPASRSEACSPTVQAPATEDGYLGFDWALDLPKLVAAFRKYGLDPSRHFDVTIVSARRIVETWKGLDSRTGSDARERINKEPPKQAIVAVTEHSSVGQGGGVTWLFRAADYECLGTIIFVTSRKLPPAQRQGIHK